MTRDEFMQEYELLGHAIQTGVAYTSPDETTNIDKHNRTGLNMVMCDVGSLGDLLIRKGIITPDEFYEAMLNGLRAEISDYEKEISEKYGANVRLA